LPPSPGACFLVEESFHGNRTVECNARMAELFISTRELQGLVDQTGLAVGHLMMRLVHCPDHRLILVRELATMALKRFGKASIDMPLTCESRHGALLRCLASIGVTIYPCGRHVLIFRIFPLGTRDLALPFTAALPSSTLREGRREQATVATTTEGRKGEREGRREE
ncbi:hypothetical protein VYU27_010666, partial [Nannochloropsis oceanica]